MSGLRILFSIHHTLDLDSGAPGSTLDLGRALAASGQDVDYLSFDDLPDWLPGGAAIYTYPYAAAARLRRAAGQGLDVVDSSTGDTWVWGRFLRRRGGPLLVTRSHGLEQLRDLRNREQAARTGEGLSWKYPLYHGGWRLREVAMSIRASDLVLVLNDEEREYVVERMGVAPERVALTANGVGRSFLEAARPTSEGTGGKAVAVLGAYRPMKGVEHGSRALAAALAADPDLRVSFLGVGVPAERVLERFEPDLHPRVTVVERYEREQLPGLLEGHSVGFFPTLAEGFSLALIEAMACGLAPLASDIAGNRRIVEDGVNGLLVAPGDAEAASAALLGLLADNALLTRLRAGARAAAESFSWELIAERTLDLYRQAASRRADGQSAAPSAL